MISRARTHEAGRQRQELRAAAPAARHQGQYEPDGLRPHRAEQLAKFDGEKWALFGETIDAVKK
jgi:hypothetical protein